MDPPKLDRRTFESLLNQPEWRARPRDEVGMVLAAIYAHYLEILLDRLNRVPDKNLLAFLDLLGVGRLPPGVATAPVIFTLAPTAGEFGFVPKGTQVATVQTETEPAVIYETEQDLNVIAAQLVAAYVIEPERDRYSDLTPVVTGQENWVFSPFRGDRLIDHSLYVGGDPLFLMQRPGVLTLNFALATAVERSQLQNLLVDLNGIVWTALGKSEALDPPVFSTSQSGATIRSFTLTFPTFKGAEVTQLNSFGLTTPLTNRWLQGKLTQPISQNPITQSIEVDNLTVQVQQTAAGLIPDQVQFNTAPIDLAGDFYPLGESPKVGDSFYIASAEALSKVEPNRPIAEQGRGDFDFEIRPSNAKLIWEFYRRGDRSNGWSRFELQSESTNQFTQNGDILFQIPTGITPISSQADAQGSFYFFRVSIIEGAYQNPPCLQITARTLSSQQRIFPLNLSFTSEVTLEAVDSNTRLDSSGLTAVDTQSYFYPFDLKPVIGHTFYFGVPIVIEPQVVQFSVRLLLQTAHLAWEFLSKTGWKRLGESSTQSSRIGSSNYELSDTTLALTREGTVSFQRPPDLNQGEVNSQINYWIRSRLISGYYGRPLEFVLINPANPVQGFKARPGTGALNAPLVSSIQINYTAQSPSPLVLTKNQFLLENQTNKNQKNGSNYKPFEPFEEKESTFYLGFDHPLPSQTSVNFYFLVPLRQVTEQLNGDSRFDAPDLAQSSKPELRWEYYNGRDWTELFIIDTTSNFTESGSVQLLGPVDMQPLRKFESVERYWIRVRLLQRGSNYTPQLSGVFLNTIQVAQKTTMKDELVGSSNGRENQRFRLAKSPVLPGQRIRVREPERPSTEKAVAIKAEIGEEAIQVTTAADGSQIYWVYWQEVKSLNGSGARNRHYTLDRITGEVRFGDGKHGLIPPEGRDNLVCEFYQAGGGAAGNQLPGKINQLKTSIPYITAVTNPLAADGGSAPETLTAAKERGPQSLKHRDRAITASDYESLVRQASGTCIARAKSLPNRNRSLQFERGWVTIIIVPEGTEKKLLPSAELIRAVEDDLANRSLATLSNYTPAHINILGPGYIPVEVVAEVVPVTLTQANAVRKAVLEALDRFFHPLTGGPDRNGWVFGRDVYLSELYAAFEALPGVEHIKNLQFKPTVASLPLKLTTSVNNQLAAGSLITIANASQPLQIKLTEDCPAGKLDLMVTLFQEGDRLTITAPNSSPDLAVATTVRSISGDTLTVAPCRSSIDLEKGSQVVSEQGALSFLTVALPASTLITNLIVQGIQPGYTLRSPDGQTFSLQVRSTPPGQQLNLGQRLRVPESFLVYSGNHTITIVPS